MYKGWVEEKSLTPTKSGVGISVAVKKLNPESLQGLEEWQVSTNSIFFFFFCLELIDSNWIWFNGFCLILVPWICSLRLIFWEGCHTPTLSS